MATRKRQRQPKQARQRFIEMTQELYEAFKGTSLISSKHSLRIPGPEYREERPWAVPHTEGLSSGEETGTEVGPPPEDAAGEASRAGAGKAGVQSLQDGA